MPEPTPTALQLRERAIELRRVAHAIRLAGLDGVVRRTGQGVWSGPGPAQCDDELAGIARSLAIVHDDLHRRASLLEQLAAHVGLDVRRAPGLA